MSQESRIRNKKSITFVCRGCDAEFETAEHYRFMRNGRFVEYRARCPDCGDRGANDRPQGDPDTRVGRTLPSYPDRDWPPRFVNIQKAEEHMRQRYPDPDEE